MAADRASQGNPQNTLAIVAIVLGVVAVIFFVFSFMRSINGGLSDAEMSKVAKPLVLPGPSNNTSVVPPPPPSGGTPTLPMGGPGNTPTLPR